MNHVVASLDIINAGRYRIMVTRIPATDVLSFYINRVRKLGPSDRDTVEGEFDLRVGDFVESTGSLDMERLGV